MKESSGEGLFSGPRKVREYDPEFKKTVINRVMSGESVPTVCGDLGIEAVSTVHGWIYQFRRQGEKSVVKKSRRPHHQPKLTSQWIVDKILLIKKEKPEMGASKVATQTGVSRVTLYRMLSEGGNPRLTSLVTLLKTLRVRLFIVDEGFAHRGDAVTRPKEQKSVEANWKYTPKGRRQ